MIVAKKSESKVQDLQTHTLWVLKEAFKIIDKSTLENIAKASGWSSERIKDLIFFACYFHDIGKATKEFQNTIQEGTKSYHSYYSASLFRSDEYFDFEETIANLLFFTILTHHTLMPYSKKASNFSFLEEAKEFFDNYKNVYEQFINKKCEYEFDFEVEKFSLSEIEDDLKELKNSSNFHKFRVIYSYVSGVLTQADWLASAKFDKNYLDFSLQTNSLDFPFTLREFQKELKNSNESVLVEIPTGEGKTEGSLLWAINNINSLNSKIVYTLPTTTTSNKLYERVQKVFAKEEVGLIHSNAKVYLEKKYEKENGIVDEYFKNEFLFIKNFAKPITVSTLDSLLKSFINIARFNLINANFLNSVVIIDEVHSYDFKLLGFLKRFLELCDELGVKVCLMSASVPNAIKELLNLNRYKLITQKDLFKKKANNISKKDIFLEDDIDAIINAYKQGKKVLVIKNTIKGATNIFNTLKNSCENILLYHSTFKKIDRNKKEELIFQGLEEKGGFLLVATQVVEISLDIDFDIMFSDVAPIDSLIQRFGRVNRKKQPDKKGEIFIYQVKNSKPYRSEIVNLSFDLIENGYFELKEYNIWLNRVYDDLFKTKVVENEIDRLFEESYKKYDTTIKNLFGIYKSSDNYDLRDIDTPKIDFLLYEDYINDKIEYEYTISLPFYYEEFEHKIPEFREDVYYKVLNEEVLYSFENGIEIANEKENFDFM